MLLSHVYDILDLGVSEYSTMDTSNSGVRKYYTVKKIYGIPSSGTNK